MVFGTAVSSFVVIDALALVVSAVASSAMVAALIACCILLGFSAVDVFS